MATGKDHLSVAGRQAMGQYETQKIMDEYAPSVNYGDYKTNLHMGEEILEILEKSKMGGRRKFRRNCAVWKRTHWKRHGELQ